MRFVTKDRLNKIYDCIGIGFGPSNISLAIALEERGLLDNVLFLEKHHHISWQLGMMLPGCDIQHNPLRDFVTPRNPQSPYGFLNYLKHKNRLFEYLNLDAPFPPRTEYAGYVNWVAEQFNAYVKLGQDIHKINFMPDGNGKKIFKIQTTKGATYFARSLSFATGRSPLIPEVFSSLMGKQVVHLNDYLWSIDHWLKENQHLHIGVVGGSQSAIEIILDLAARAPHAHITNISRGFGFKQKDLSPFTEQIYFPEFVDYFYNASITSQNEITKELWRSNYGAADHDVIAALNFKLYEQKCTGNKTIELLHNKCIQSAFMLQDNNKIGLHLTDKHSNQQDQYHFDAIILATGFKNFGNGPDQEAYHPLLKGIIKEAVFRADGGLSILRDFRMEYKNDQDMPPIFINGLCESSHGFGDAGSFSLLSIRADVIANALEGFLKTKQPSEVLTFEVVNYVV